MKLFRGITSTCDNCKNDELILVCKVWWAKMVFLFLRCSACNHEEIHYYDEARGE